MFKSTTLFDQYVIRHRQAHAEDAEYIKHFHTDGKAGACPFCGSDKIMTTGDVIENSNIVEYYETCHTCGQHISYWAYGSYAPQITHFERQLGIA